MQANQLERWRKTERERLIAARVALKPQQVSHLARKIDAHIELAFKSLLKGTIGIYWPILNEYDARHLARGLRAQGAVTALPVVIARDVPLIFREWRPGAQLAESGLGIRYPVSSAEVWPDIMILPMNGWDSHGYRLGYGAGFFDRTLANRAKSPVTIGVSYEMARMATIRPQGWDVPVDYVVTERGVYRRNPEGLSLLISPPVRPGLKLSIRSHIR